MGTIINAYRRLNVKNTMIDIFLKYIAPHRCYGCGKVGKCLCESCKYYIIEEPFRRCLSCLKPISQKCSVCIKSYTKSWCVGELDGVIKELIYDYKFKNLKQAFIELSDLLSASIDELEDVVVTAIPTLPNHIRRRGYDHTKLIAVRFAKLRGLKYEDTIIRISKTTQHNSTASMRWKQAQKSFTAKKVKKHIRYLLIDDIVTTGATIENASKCLLKAGAKEVYVATIARQTLD